MNANHELREAAKSTATTRSPKQWTRQLTRDRLALAGPLGPEIEIPVTNGPPYRGRPLMAGPTSRPSLAERRLVAVTLAERAGTAIAGLRTGDT